jgi:lambda family phage portal protein
MRANLIDRAIGFVAPRAALRRMHARAAYDAARSYSGAALGRHTDGWKAPATSADAEVASAGSRLRDRHRDLVRNNPHAAKAVSSWVTSIIGDGIMPRTADKKVMDAFKRWSRECDADGQLDFYGLQTLVVREMVEGGEVLIRRRRRRAADGLHVPLQLQVLEADHLDSTKHGALAGGNVAVQGIEFNLIGQRQNYWMFADHPGGFGIGALSKRLASSPVAAGEIVHLYEKQRTQVRGVPWGAPIIRDVRDHGDYKFAEGIRKKLESSYVGAVLCDDAGEDGVTTSTGGATITDARGNPVEQFEPGLFAIIRGGKDIKFNAPAAVAGYAEYDKRALHAIAAGYRLPYELVSGDLSEVNYSSMRAGLLEFRRLVRAMQWQLVIPIFLQPIWDWFCAMAWLAGLIDSPNVPVEWDTPRFEWVDPYKDGLADVLAIRGGVKTWYETVAERGRNPADVLAEIIAFNKLMDDNNIVLDIDPRKTSRAGLTQAMPAGTQLPGAQLPGEDDPPVDDDDEGQRSRRGSLKLVR